MLLFIQLDSTNRSCISVAIESYIHFTGTTATWEGVSMVTHCSPNWPTDFKSATTKTQCEQDHRDKQEVTPTDKDQFRRISPVSTEKVTYKNVFCAQCNGIPPNATIYDWTPIIACSQNFSGKLSAWLIVLEGCISQYISYCIGGCIS